MPDGPATTLSAADSRRHLRVFLCTNFIYVWIVFGWSLTLYPLGIDFAYLADAVSVSEACRRVFATLAALGGEQLIVYRIFNILLLYLCMVAILFLTRYVLNGPWWLGSLAAVLTMANPAKSEAILHLSAVVHLLPATAALSALAAFAAWHRKSGFILYGLSLLLTAFAVLNFPENAALPLVLFLLYIAIPTGRMANPLQLLPFSLLAVAGLLRMIPMYEGFGFNAASQLAPLYLALYPLGLLPGTAVHFEQWPFLWVLPGVGMAGLALLAWRRSGQPAVVFGVLGAVLFRLTPLDEFDFVHIKGGGSLIVPLALLYLAMASVWMHIQRHPRWRRSAVTLTTVLCILFMAMQVQTLWRWRQAAAITKAVQSRTLLSVEESGGEPVALAPDYRFFDGAPIASYACVGFDTPFSRALPVRTAFAMNYFPSDQVEVSLVEWSPLTALVEVRGATLAELFDPEIGSMDSGDTINYENFQMEIQENSEERIRLRIYPLNDFLPETVVPLGNTGAGLALRPESIR